MTTTPSTPNGNEPAPAPEPKSEPKAPAGAPETYAAFTLPEGYKLDDSVLSTATPIFKELGLTQEQAQKLVEFHVGQMKEASEGPLNLVQTLRSQWQGELKADTEIGSKLPQVKVEIDRALATIGDAKLVNDFKAAMNLTGVGDHPAFAKLLYKLAQKIPTEGTHVQGGGPSPHGQAAHGVAQRPSAAQAMFPNLPSSNPR